MASSVRLAAAIESGDGDGGGTEPDVTIHLPHRSRQFASSLGTVGSGGRRQVSIVEGELDQNSVKALLCNANLRMPNVAAIKAGATPGRIDTPRSTGRVEDGPALGDGRYRSEMLFR